MKEGMVRWAERGRAFLSGQHGGALLATVLTLGLLLGVWWQAQLWYGTRLAAGERAIVTSEIVPYGNALTSATNRRFALLAGLRAFTEVQFRSPGGMSEAEFETFAAGLYATTSGIRNLTVAPGGVTAYIYPRAGYEFLLNHDLIDDERPNVRADVQRTIQTHQIALSDPLYLDTGRPGRGGPAGCLRGRQVSRTGDRSAGPSSLVQRGRA